MKSGSSILTLVARLGCGSLIEHLSDFLRHSAPHSHVVVHGHTICDPVAECANRIGIDTGAYRTGKLTALVLEGDTRRYIPAADEAGTITIRKMGTAQ